jgi:hypothetical protein
MSDVMSFLAALSWFGLHWQAVAIGTVAVSVLSAAVDFWTKRERRPKRQPVRTSVPACASRSTTLIGAANPWGE